MDWWRAWKKTRSVGCICVYSWVRRRYFSSKYFVSEQQAQSQFKATCCPAIKPIEIQHVIVSCEGISRALKGVFVARDAVLLAYLALPS